MTRFRRFSAAPWPNSLKLSSALCTTLFIGTDIAAYRVIPVPTGFTHYFGLGVALIPPAVLVFSTFFMVRGYVVSSAQLGIKRLFWTTTIPLSGLQAVRQEPAICKGTVRIFGNAGLFGFTGLYRNDRLGRFRLFATNLAYSVILTMPHRTVVITPAEPEDFIKYIHSTVPPHGPLTSVGF